MVTVNRNDNSFASPCKGEDVMTAFDANESPAMPT